MRSNARTPVTAFVPCARHWGSTRGDAAGVASRATEPQARDLGAATYEENGDVESLRFDRVC